MKVAIDITPLSDNRLLSHRVRGTGFYLENLKNSLLNYHKKDKFFFFEKRSEIPKDVDIIHYPYFEPFFPNFSIFQKAKRIITVHDLTPLVFPHEFPSGIKGKISWQVQKMNLKKSRRIITDSISSKNDIVDIVGIDKDKIDVVYLAAAEHFKRFKINDLRLMKTREKYKLPEKFVLYVGDVTWNKNLPRLIRAIQEVNLTLVMVGKSLLSKDYDKSNSWNKDLSEVQKLADQDKRIIRLGFVPDDDLVNLYNAATVFVMPSLYEGFGLPILEAMASGCPVVTTRCGSIPEVAGDAAYYADPYDITAIANAIGEVYSSKKLQLSLSRKGLIQAKKFSWKKTAFQTLKTYRKAVSL